MAVCIQGQEGIMDSWDPQLVSCPQHSTQSQPWWGSSETLALKYGEKVPWKNTAWTREGQESSEKPWGLGLHSAELPGPSHNSSG